MMMVFPAGSVGLVVAFCAGLALRWLAYVTLRGLFARSENEYKPTTEISK
ncbi:hypothetical protein [Mycobacterium simiae]|nr:hypothetical protein [Mycobacterium simiae]